MYVRIHVLRATIRFLYARLDFLKYLKHSLLFTLI